jgi:hypothetical protein
MDVSLGSGRPNETTVILLSEEEEKAELELDQYREQGSDSIFTCNKFIFKKHGPLTTFRFVLQSNLFFSGERLPVQWGVARQS